MIYLANSMRRQHCARLGIIILFKLNEDKGKTNLLSLCTIGQKKEELHCPHLLCATFCELSVCLTLGQQAFATNSTRFQ